MSLIRWRPRREWDPFVDLLDLQEEMNKLFDMTLARRPERGGLLERGWIPALDIYEEKDNMIIRADIPGMKQNEIDISIKDNILTITGERKKESEIKEEKYYRMERVYGSFERSITLPASVDSSKVKATYKDGVLQIVLPKTEEAKPKQIKVEVK